MKLIRFAVPVILLFIAVPSFAICGPCDFNCNCQYDPSWGSGCKAYDPLTDCCKDTGNPCGTGVAEAVTAEAAPQMLAAEYEVASVEVVTPAGRTTQANTTRVADASVSTPTTR